MTQPIFGVVAFVLLVLPHVAFASAPTVGTGTVSRVSSTSARLSGTANPNGEATEIWLRVATSPGACSESFGERVPEFGGGSIPAGSIPYTYSVTAANLSAATTHWYCAVAQNASGIRFGEVHSFNLALDTPTATTGSVTEFNARSAVLVGIGTPRGQTARGWFRIGITPPGVCSDSFGTRAPASGGVDLGAGLAGVRYTHTASGLEPARTYYFCAVVESAGGIAFGDVQSFTTMVAAPSVADAGPTNLAYSSVTLNGIVRANGAGATVEARYGTTTPTTCDSSWGSMASLSGSSWVDGPDWVSVRADVTGLASGKTHHYCISARNSYGGNFAAGSFVTPTAAPEVTTKAATSIGGTSVTANAIVNAAGLATTVWFRYSTVDPGVCDDTFGTRVPATGGTVLAANAMDETVSKPLSGLTQGTPYYVCALASNAKGLRVGLPVPFMTAAPPTITPEPASEIAYWMARLTADVNPQGLSTKVFVHWGTTNPGTCTSGWGSWLQPEASIGAGQKPVDVGWSLTGLLPGRTYYYCFTAINALGTTIGPVQSFTAAPNKPAVTTSTARDVAMGTVELSASVEPNGADTSVWFRVTSTSTTTCDDTVGTRVPETGGVAAGDGITPVAITANLTGLVPGESFHCCVVAENAYGKSLGVVRSNHAAALATTTTLEPSLLTETSARLSGTVYTPDVPGLAWFRVSTSPGTCSDTFGERAPTTGDLTVRERTNVPVTMTLSGLVPLQTYYFCVIGSNVSGLSFGEVIRFVTPTVPSVETGSVDVASAESITLNGLVTPNGALTGAWFRHATVNPGACNDTFGTRVGARPIGSDLTPQPVSVTVTNLLPLTTYYYCAIGSNERGVSYGAVRTFTTPTGLPLVYDQAPTDIGPGEGTLNALVTSNALPATAWFRWSTTYASGCSETWGTREPASGELAVPASSTPVPVSHRALGLPNATVVYWCAVARNAHGTRVSIVRSMQMPDVPQVINYGAQGQGETTVRLAAGVAPSGAPTRVWFRYSRTAQPLCSDAFVGETVPAEGIDAGSGSSLVTVFHELDDLLPATQYWLCVVAENGVGRGYGLVRPFTPPSLPVVTTSPARTAPTSLFLRGQADAPHAVATAYFRWSYTNPSTCDDTFGTRVPATGGSTVGVGASSTLFEENVTGLAEGATIYYCAIVQNPVGMGVGSVLSARMLRRPVVSTLPPSELSTTGGTLAAAVTPSGTATSVWFRYATTRPTACSDFFGSRRPTSGEFAIGDGETPVPVTTTLTGHSPGTTIWYCALARNAAMTVAGELVSFVVPRAPTVTTTAASATASTVLLNGSANPNGTDATTWFRIGTADPGTCTEAFGTRVPESGGIALGNGTTTLPFSRTVDGLLPGTTYYFCAVVRNAAGTYYGNVLTTGLLTAPAVTTGVPSPLTGTDVNLVSNVNPLGLATTAYFRVSSTLPTATRCDDSFGSRVPASGGVSAGNGTAPRAIQLLMSGLVSGRTYYGCAAASNSAGTTFGEFVTFLAPAVPVVTTLNPLDVTARTVTLRGRGNPRGASAKGFFHLYATPPTSCTRSYGTRYPTSFSGVLDPPLGAGTESVDFSVAVSVLSPGTTYWYCAFANNLVGEGTGSPVTFTTPDVPRVTSLATTDVIDTAARLHASVHPMGSPSTAWFRLSATTPASCNDTFGMRVPEDGGTALAADSEETFITQVLTGLARGTTYYVCPIASSEEGLGYGALTSFRTADAPSVVTGAAGSVTGSSATIEGVVVPNGLVTTVWLQIGAGEVDTCTSTFGRRVPAAGGTALGAGATAVTYTQAVTGLDPGTTYSYCVFAENASGSSIGGVRRFTTAAPPTVSTLGAVTVAGGLELSGAAVANRAKATAWFRYATSAPAACDDSFGTRLPTSGGVDVGSSEAQVLFARTIGAVTEGTRYHYCAIAQNAAGTTFGEVRSIRIPGRPAVVTHAAAAVRATSAMLVGEASSNTLATTAWFRFGTGTPASCSDTFGSRLPTTPLALDAGAEAETFTHALTGLSPDTTYAFCAVAENARGRTSGAIRTFRTPAVPSVSALAPVPVDATQATLRATVTTDGEPAIAWFRIGQASQGICDDASGTRVPEAGGTIVDPGTATVEQRAEGLDPATEYRVCAFVENGNGRAVGSAGVYRHPGAPIVTSGAASAVTGTTVILHAGVDGNGAAGIGWFRYDTRPVASCGDEVGSRAPAEGGEPIAAGGGNAFAVALAGLQPGTTYWYCAGSMNLAGPSFGEVRSFTTPRTPTVETSGATAIGARTVTLHGAAAPNGAATAGWFRFGEASEEPCGDAFGSRVPATGGDPLGDGTSAVPFEETVAGLLPGVTYAYCAIAANAGGTVVGVRRTVTTAAAAPEVTTAAPRDVTHGAALLTGSIAANGSPTLAWFRVGIGDDLCDDEYGERVPATGGIPIGTAALPLPVEHVLSDLLPGTTYRTCLVAQNGEGVVVGEVEAFTTAARAPTILETYVGDVTGRSATLTAAIVPNGAPTVAWYRLGPATPDATCDDEFGARVPDVGDAALDDGTSEVQYAEFATALRPGVTYAFCVVAENAEGRTHGVLRTFTTAIDVPAVVTGPATVDTAHAATLTALVIANGAPTTAWFLLSSPPQATCDPAVGERIPITGGATLPAGHVESTVSFPATELLSGRTYGFCAVAENAAGNGLGEVRTFATPALAPTVSLASPSTIEARAALLVATVSPNGAETTTWFRYAQTAPSACTDDFGQRVPETGGRPVGEGHAPAAVRETVTGLLPGATWYACAFAENAAGLAAGDVVAFTTPAAPPAIETLAAEALSGTEVQLRASATANGAATTAWFRVSDSEPATCVDGSGVRVPPTGGVELDAAAEGAVELVAEHDGLVAGATYWACAYAVNDTGVTAGSPVAFRMPAPPLAQTLLPTAVGTTTATLRGLVTAGGAPTVAWFRFDTQEPTHCDDTFGRRAPREGEVLVVAEDAVDAPVSIALDGLEPATKYFACVLARNIAGETMGHVESFVTTSAPSVVTGAPTLVRATSARLHGVATPHGLATDGWFRFGLDADGPCDDTFGQRVPAQGSLPLGDGQEAVPFDADVAALDPSRTYAYCAVAGNDVGVTVGGTMRFIPSATAPSVRTHDAEVVEARGATLRGTATPEGTSTTAWFRYDGVERVSCDDTFGTRVPPDGLLLGDGYESVSFEAALTGLRPNGTYFACAIAANLGGVAFGAIVRITTPPAQPAATTLPADVDSRGVVTLRGTVSTGGSDGVVEFRYGTERPSSCDASFGQAVVPTTAVGADAENFEVAARIEGLAAGEYFHCVTLETTAGEAFGEVHSFTISTAMADEGCGCHTGSDGVWSVLVGALLVCGRRRKEQATR